MRWLWFSLLAGFLGYAVGMGGAKLALPLMAESKNAHLIWDSTVAFSSIGQTVVMVTHNPENSAYSDRTISLRDGLVVTAQT